MENMSRPIYNTTATVGSLNVDSTGAVSTGTTASGTMFIGAGNYGSASALGYKEAPATDAELIKQNRALKQRLEQETEERESAERQLVAAQRQLRAAQEESDQLRTRLQDALRAETTVSASSFSRKELDVMLSKLHPDKNDGSEMCGQITKKIIQARKR